MKDFMHQYVRDEDNNPVGIMIAKKVNDTVFITGSHVNIKAGDKFDKNIAMEIAVGRMEYVINGVEVVNYIAHNMRDDTAKFTYRVARYFKVPVNSIITPRIKHSETDILELFN